ncbi:MAG: ABC transporter permease [Chitinophagales bacterium]
MFFNKKKDDAIEKIIKNNKDQSYWANVNRQFKKNRLAVWSLRVFFVILFIALTADFLANEKPIVCKIDSQVSFPIFKQYAVDLGITNWEKEFVIKQWSEHDYQFAIFPLIPYSPTTMDKYNRQYVGPFDEQRNIKSFRWRHFMGTDELGRDVTAGMIHGARIAVSVGVIAMAIASFIGIFIGSLAGYFGDNRLKVSIIRLILNSISIIFAIFYGFITRAYAIGVASKEGGMLWELLKSVGIFLFIMLLANVLASVLKKIPLLSRKVTIAVDILIMRFIEVLNSIPTLLLILSIVAITKPSIINVMIIIGLVGWTGIARFIRAELLRVRSLEYIEAAQAMGFSEARIIFRHAIPNALTPVLIAIAFGVASAILTEAFLSFLGIGVDVAEDVTWGSLLNLARNRFSAWWLAIFPGFAIFITVTIFNLIGEGLTDALDPRLKQ